MAWLKWLIAAVVHAALAWLVDRSRPTAIDADPDKKLRDRLRAKVKRHF